MTKEAAQYFEAGKTDERTIEEVRESLRERNERVEWPVQEMLPEVFGEGNDDEQRERARADD